MAWMLESMLIMRTPSSDIDGLMMVTGGCLRFRHPGMQTWEPWEHGLWRLGGLGREEICRCNAAPSPVPTPSRCFHDEDWRIWGLEESQLQTIDQPSRADQ